MVSVVLFSGGRGSDVLSRQLIGHADVALTIAINGYDDGASTGEVRRFLGDSLGPSDFRKNASRVARELHSCPDGLIECSTRGCPNPCSREEACGRSTRVAAASGPRVRQRIEAVRARARSGRAFEFSDCAVGNLVFAGSYLLCGRRFNDAVDDYCGLLGLPPASSRTSPTARTHFSSRSSVDRGVLVSEAEIVDAKQQNRISDVFLIDRPPVRGRSGAPGGPVARTARRSGSRSGRSRVPLNPRLRERIAAADLIIYAPGTQHSSLFPSYLTKDLSRAIASNLTAMKLLVTNIQADAEISGSTAVDIVERAVYYLKEKGQLPLPVPSLITHYIINDPKIPEAGRGCGVCAAGPPRDARRPAAGPHRALRGRRERPPRCLEGADTVSRIRSFRERRRQRVAVWLYDAASLNKLSQSVLEMLRGGIQDLARRRHGVLHGGRRSRRRLHAAAADRAAESAKHAGEPPGKAFAQALGDREFDYAVLFESSGMYREKTSSA